MKSKLSTPDVIAVVRDLSARILSYRVLNIYDVEVNGKTFLLRLGESNAAGAVRERESGGAARASKVTLLIESGVRLHTTRYAREKPTFPGSFCMKLRKHIRGRRVTSITQMGASADGTSIGDRVVDICFGTGAAAYHLIIELYDRGNVILTDSEFTILSLLRQYSLDAVKEEPGADDAAAGAGDGDAKADGKPSKANKPAGGKEGKDGGKEKYVDDGTHVRIGVKSRYVLADRALKASAPGTAPPLDLKLDDAALSAAIAAHLAVLEAKPMNAKARRKLTLAAALVSRDSGVDDFGPVLLEHAVACAGIDPAAPVSALKATHSTAAGTSGGGGGVWDPAAFLRVAAQLHELPALLRRLATEPSPGFAFLEYKAPLDTVATTAATASATAELTARWGGASTAASAVARAGDSTLAGLPSSGCVGTWAHVQELLRGALPSTAASVTAAPDISTPAAGTSVSGAPPASASAADASAAVIDASADAAAGAGAGGGGGEGGVGDGATDAGDEDFSAEAQSPPDVPFTFTDFSPFLFGQYTCAHGADNTPYVIFPDFDACVDEYFSRLDIVKAERAETAARVSALRKVDRVREGHKEAIAALVTSHSDSYAKGRVLEACAPRVEAACLVVRSALEHGVNWDDLLRLVAAEAAGGNPIASLIKGMDLARGTITLALRDEEAAAAAAASDSSSGSASDTDSNEGDAEGARSGARGGGKPAVSAGASGVGATAASGSGKAGRGRGPPPPDPFTLLVDVDVFSTAAANARRHYEAGKAARAKADKTAATADTAVRRAERSMEAEAAKRIAAVSAIKTISVARKPAWYERFYWFITLEGLVCVAGKNATDNEALVKRYLRPQDAYIHAEVHGAATVVLRNPSTEPSAAATLQRYAMSLEAAGAFCVCLSNAWTSHVATSAYWVAASQVSKTAPTGEYLTTGSFMIRGRKNMLPPVKLELGFALLFKVDPICVAAHTRDRYVRGGADASSTAAGTGAGVSSSATSGGTTSHSASRSATVSGGEHSASAAGVGASAIGADASISSTSATTESATVAPSTDTTDTTTPALVHDAPHASHTDAASGDDGDDGAGVRDRDSPVSSGSSTGDGAHERNGSDDADVSASGEGTSTSVTGTGAGAGAGVGADVTTALAARSTGVAGSATNPYEKGIPVHVRRRAKKLASERGCSVEEALAALALAATASGSGTGKGGATARVPSAEDSGSSESDVEPDGTATATGGGGAAAARTAAGGGGSSSAKPAPVSRGKLRKMREKYADQDEEDRRLASAAIGHAFDAPAPAPTTAPGASGARGATSSGVGPSVSTGSARGGSAAGAGGGGAKKREVEDESPAVRAAAEAAAAADTDASALAALVMAPRGDDILTHVVPMLCPYSVALACKYRVKLVPGSLKKGKAGQAAAHAFEVLAKASGTARETELIHALTDVDLSAPILGNVKVVAAAGDTGGGAVSAKSTGRGK